MEEFLIKAFDQGGFAVAFVIIFWMYKDLWQRRNDDLKMYTEALTQDRTELMEALRRLSEAMASWEVTSKMQAQELIDHRAEMNIVTAALRQELKEQLAAHRVEEERLFSRLLKKTKE